MRMSGPLASSRAGRNSSSLDNSGSRGWIESVPRSTTAGLQFAKPDSGAQLRLSNDDPGRSMGPKCGTGPEVCESQSGLGSTPGVPSTGAQRKQYDEEPSSGQCQLPPATRASAWQSSSHSSASGAI